MAISPRIVHRQNYGLQSTIKEWDEYIQILKKLNSILNQFHVQLKHVLLQVL